MFQVRFLYEQLPNCPSCHAGTIVELPSGEYLAAWYAGSWEGHQDVAIYAAHLRHELHGWQDVRSVVNTPGKSEGNPVLHVDRWGHVWLFYVTQQEPGWDNVLMYARKSEDEGRTWGDPVLLSETLGWMTKNKPLRLSCGRTLLPCYDERTWRSFCLLSDDECVSWRPSGWIEGPVPVIQPTLLERPDGTILALLRSGPPEDRPEQRLIWRSLSEDGGLTWSPCEPTALPNPNSGTDTTVLDTGHAVLAYNHSATCRSPLTLALSTDGGETWPVRRDVETEAAEFSYPAIIQGHGGRIHLLYTWKRTHMKHVVLTEDWITGVERQ